MEIAKLTVRGTWAEAVARKPIPRGIIGGQVRIAYTDSLWDDLIKTVVFDGGGVTKDIVNPGELVTIPPEVVEQEGTVLRVGVYGTDSQQNLVIPTLWASIGMVRNAASPSGDTSTDESLPVWAQLLDMIGNLEDLDTEAKESLVAAINEAVTKGGDAAKEAAESLKVVLEKEASAKSAAENAAQSLVGANTAEESAAGYAGKAKEFADTAAGYAGAATVSIGWDADGYFSIFEQEEE